MELRKVNELAELEELPQEASVILVDGNEAKRIPVSKTGLKTEGLAVANTVFTIEIVDTVRKLKLNGVEATAQQVYDAFMSGPVRLADSEYHSVEIPPTMYWENSDGTQTNPKTVSFVQFYYAPPINGSLTYRSFEVGTKYAADEG